MSTEDHPYGDYTLRTMKSSSGWIGIIVGNSKDKFSASSKHELLKLLQDTVHSKVEGFVGWDGALKRFSNLFSDGFEDSNYIGSKEFGEQFYKRDMAERTQTEFPLKRWRELEKPQETALRLFRGTNLIDPFTKTALQNCLRSHKAYDFLEICEAFAFGDIKSATTMLNNDPELKTVRKWPALTYLPFFWKPTTHFFLKPRFTREFAMRVGHSFAMNYRAEPNLDTYDQLLELAEITKVQCKNIKGSGSIDNIDVHSFMWTVIDYTEDNIGPQV